MHASDIYPNYEKWVWIELIGFDNKEKDFGVGQFIDRAGVVPDAVSLLLFNADFIHTHDDMKPEDEFPDDFCSYYGHKYCEERQRQTWSKFQLKGLIENLQGRAIKVYVSFFDRFASKNWIGQHTELWHMYMDGTTTPSVCPWKRLSDGSYYEDFFIEKLVNVMNYYGFDGLHGADGYGHPRLYLNKGDFSDDMVEQFLRATRISLPDNMAENCNGSPELIKARSEWIWNTKRREWIKFYTSRIRAFWRKVIQSLHSKQKFVVLNSAWTRDPLEAIYRCGIDYKGLVEDGVDGFIVETAAAGAALEGYADGDAPKTFSDFLAMGLLNKACMPNVPLRFLNGVKDTLEEFHCLKHMPTLLEREILALSNLFWFDENGSLKPVYSGPVVCLADSITANEWNWLRDRWNLGYSYNPQKLLGVTVVWSDAAFENQLDDYIETRKITSHKLIQNLIARGTSIQAVVNINHIEKVYGPILVIHPTLLSDPELQKVLAYKNGAIIMIGGSMSSLPRTAIEFEDVYPPDQLSCKVYGVSEKFEAVIEKDGPENLPADLFKDVIEPPNFLHELYFRKVSGSFLQTCVNVIRKCVHGVKVLNDPKNLTRVVAMQSSSSKVRLLVENNRYSYFVAEIDVGREISRVEVLNGAFTGPHVGRCPFLEELLPVQSGSTFKLKIPPVGMLVVDVVLKSQGDRN